MVKRGFGAEWVEREPARRIVLRPRAERMARKKQAVAGKEAQRDAAKQEAIKAALERVKQKKSQSGVTPRNVDNLTPEQKEKIEEVRLENLIMRSLPAIHVDMDK